MKTDNSVFNLAHKWGREAEANFKEAREALESSGEGSYYRANALISMGEETYLHASQLLQLLKPEQLAGLEQQADSIAAAIMEMP
jgi:hypothetical protein